MLLNRTDLAMEIEGISHGAEGILYDKRERDGITTVRITVETDDAAKRIGKPKGKYISISAPGILYDSMIYENTVDAVSEIIKEFRDTKKSVLVAGLGNRSITPDALGPEVVSRIFVTRHMKGRLDFDFVKELGDVSAIAPGVLGTTGLKTSKILKGIVNIEKPELIIAVDAYCAKSLDRISTTIQVSDSGVIPGGGVGNRQAAINEETMGVPVIAIGIPTVADAVTVAAGIMKSEDEDGIRRNLGEDCERLIVTPKDIDIIIDRGAKTIANAINKAFNPTLSLEEIESFTA